MKQDCHVFNVVCFVLGEKLDHLFVHIVTLWHYLHLAVSTALGLLALTKCVPAAINSWILQQSTVTDGIRASEDWDLRNSLQRKQSILWHLMQLHHL